MVTWGGWGRGVGQKPSGTFLWSLLWWIFGRKCQSGGLTGGGGGGGGRDGGGRPLSFFTKVRGWRGRTLTRHCGFSWSPPPGSWRCRWPGENKSDVIKNLASKLQSYFYYFSLFGGFLFTENLLWAEFVLTKRKLPASHGWYWWDEWAASKLFTSDSKKRLRRSEQSDVISFFYNAICCVRTFPSSIGYNSAGIYK